MRSELVPLLNARKVTVISSVKVETGCKEFTLHRVQISCMLILTISTDKE